VTILQREQSSQLGGFGRKNLGKRAVLVVWVAVVPQEREQHEGKNDGCHYEGQQKPAGDAWVPPAGLVGPEHAVDCARLGGERNSPRSGKSLREPSENHDVSAKALF
jgi:hypothetical protein